MSAVQKPLEKHLHHVSYVLPLLLSHFSLLSSNSSTCSPILTLTWWPSSLFTEKVRTLSRESAHFHQHIYHLPACDSMFLCFVFFYEWIFSALRQGQLLYFDPTPHLVKNLLPRFFSSLSCVISFSVSTGWFPSVYKHNVISPTSKIIKKGRRYFDSCLPPAIPSFSAPFWSNAPQKSIYICSLQLLSFFC